MKTIEGYNVKIFTNNIEDTALDQIKQLLSIDVFSNKKIRIMPEVHAGAGYVIGFTGNFEDMNGFIRDESPMDYKSAEEIIANIGNTKQIETIIRPIFNFKPFK